jgi:XTP/dITP diphosphohydrolase
VTKLLIATRSRGKQKEFRALLSAPGLEIVFPDDIGIPESAAEDRLEVHQTFAANARAKAKWFCDRSGLATLADDSGLEVDALDGAPGVLSKRFAGVTGLEDQVTAANNVRLLEALRDLPPSSRTARYRCVLVLICPDGREFVADGTVEGVIVTTPDGGNGFGYDPLFFCTELGTTFGCASAAAKHAVSHRARAVSALGDVRRLLG